MKNAEKNAAQKLVTKALGKGFSADTRISGGVEYFAVIRDSDDYWVGGGKTWDLAIENAIEADED